MIISNELAKILEKYSIERDTIGQSPAEVYKLIGNNENLYLKYSKKIYQSTTYCVCREANIIEWLNGKINLPKIIYKEVFQGNSSLIMTELKGVILENCNLSPNEYIKYLVKGLLEIQSIDITKCSFVSTVDYRLNELKYLFENNLTDNDCNNWEKTTEFSSPEELYKWLNKNKPNNEELVFSHGDFCVSNLLLNGNNLEFIDFGRAGIADKWYDIAFCVREIQDLLNDEKYINMFFELLKIKPDWEKINYYILLDELF